MMIRFSLPVRLVGGFAVMLVWPHSLVAEEGASASPSTTPVSRTEGWWVERHEAKLEEVAARAAEVRLVFAGDSITQGWEGAGAALWEERFAPAGALNLGYSGDRTEHVLWRLRHGEWPEDLRPDTVVLMIGTNNTGHGEGRPAAETAEGITMIVGEMVTRAPDATIVLLGIFPRGRGADDARRQVNEEINLLIAPLGERENVVFRDIGAIFLDEDGGLPEDVMPDALHPNARGYELWAEAMVEILEEVRAP